MARKTRKNQKENRRPQEEKRPTRMALIGTRASGKSTCIGLLNLTAMDMAFEYEDGHAAELQVTSVVIDELVSTVRDVMDNLREGRFPPPTPSGQGFHSTLTLSFQRQRKLRPSKKFSAELALTDVAGETMDELMSSLESGSFALTGVHDIDEINKFILGANAFALIVDVENVIASAHSEEEQLGPKQDVALARFVDSLNRWKQQNQSSPKVKSVALIGTKYDQVKSRLSSSEYGNLDNNLRGFMRNYLPQTWISLSSLLRDQKIAEQQLRVFYSGVDISLGDYDDEPRINRVPGKMRPSYSDDQYRELVHWIGEIAQ